MNDLLKSDKNDMFSILKDYPNDIKKARKMFDNPEIGNIKDFQSIVICGMGGSAIAGEITGSLINYHTENTPNQPTVFINREYTLPHFVNENTLVILSSYSGNTEETLFSALEAGQLTKKIICITTGGELENFAKKNNLPIIELPKGFQPRCALVYALIALLNIIAKLGISIQKVGLDKYLEKIEKNAAEKMAVYSDINDDNIAIQIARKLQNKIPVIYSEGKYLGAISLRWRQQIHENAKQICFGNVLPEMNHNEINSWNFPKQLIAQSQVVFLRDEHIENNRMALRFTALTKILTDENIELIQISPEGDSLLERLFDLIYLGDWVSYYLAMLNETDPTDIPFIMYLKDYLGKN